MDKRKRKLGAITIAFIFILGSIPIYSNIVQTNDKVSAANIPVQSEKIVRVEGGQDSMYQSNVDHIFLLTEKGEAYTNTSKTDYKQGGEVSDASSYWKLTDNEGIIIKNIKSISVGNTVYSKDYGSFVTKHYNPVFAMLTNDSVFYAWGDNTHSQYGISASSSNLPVKITPTTDGSTLIEEKIIDVVSSDFNIYLLTENGSVYASGDNSLGQRGNGTTSSNDYFSKVEVSNIKQLIALGSIILALDSDGNVWRWGGTIGFDTQSTPIQEVDLVSINMLVKNSKNLGFWPIFAAISNDNQIITGRYDGGKRDISKADISSLGTVDKAISMLASAASILNDWGVLSGNKLYTSSGDTYKQYITNEITADTKILDFSHASAKWLVVTDEGVAFDGNYFIKLSIGVKGKTSNSKDYISEQKTRQSVTLSYEKSDIISGVSYQVKEGTDETFGDLIPLSDGETISVLEEENKRIYKEYMFKDNDDMGVEVSFVVDIYHHDFNPNKMSILSNGTYAKHQAMIWETGNGLDEKVNKVTAILTDGSGNQTQIASGYQIDTISGSKESFRLELVDEYGNKGTYDFDIVDAAAPVGLDFTPSDDLIYKKVNTNTNGILGKGSLTYKPGDAVSQIDGSEPVTIDQGDENGYFVTSVDPSTGDVFIKAAKDVPVGTYELSLSGKDKNGINFNGFKVSFVVEPAENLMDFDTTSKNASSKGIYYKDSLKVAIDETTLPDGIKKEDIVYRLKGTDPNVVVASDGTISVNAMSGDEMTFTIEAYAAASDNYKEKVKELTIKVSKRTLKLKVLIDAQATGSIVIGETLPTFAVQIDGIAPEGFNLTQPESFGFFNDKNEEVNDIKSIGSYQVQPKYTDDSIFDDYKVEWTYGTLKVDAVTITDENKDDFYQLTLSDRTTSYTPGTWTKDTIIIHPKHGEYRNMEVNTTGTFSTDPQPFKIEGKNDVALEFVNDDRSLSTSTNIAVWIDQTKPTIEDNTYQDIPQDPISAILNKLTFNKYFSKEQLVTFHAKDDGSDIKTIHYVVEEIDETGTVIRNVAEGDGTSYHLAVNKNYKITVTAIDNAGNESVEKVETVRINDEVSDIKLEAKLSETQTEYKETWTNQGIDIKLSSDQDIDVWYVKIKDEPEIQLPTGTDMYTISNTENVDNVTYEFWGVSVTGVKTESKQIQVKIDTITPTFELAGSTSKGAYTSGTETEEDVTLRVTNTNTTPSGVTYYYCTDTAASTTDPTVNGAWQKVNGEIKITASGTHTYYVKAVSGAGIISEAQSFDVSIQKKAYTDIKITGTSNQQPYQSGEWTNKDITLKVSGGLEDPTMIRGYEYTITTGAKPDTSATWQSVPKNGADYEVTVSEEKQNQEVVYWFRVDADSDKEAVSFVVNLDKTAPTIKDIKITYTNKDGLSELLHQLTFGQFFNKAVKVEISAEDNLSEKETLKLEYAEVKGTTIGEWNLYTTPVAYGDGTNLVLNVRAIDEAGNVSEVVESDPILLDLMAPIIKGVESNQTYYVPHKVHMEDHVSGLSMKDCFIKLDQTSSVWEKDTMVKTPGSYQVYAKDQAGNNTEITFRILPLPDPEELTKGDEHIIDQVVDEYEKNKDDLTKEEQKEIEDWIEIAKEKIKNYVEELVNDQTNAILKGQNGTKFEEDIELGIDSITDQFHATDLHLEKVEGLNEDSKLQEAFDIYLRKGSKVVSLQSDGSVKVMLPYTKEHEEMKDMQVVSLENQDVKVIAYKIETVNGSSYITFETNTLGKYGIVAKQSSELNESKINIDTDQDGLPDLNIDLDGDGTPDINIDLNEDGIPDLNIDVDGDGTPDLNIDTTGNGEPDDMIYKVTKWEPYYNCKVNDVAYDTMDELKKIVEELKDKDKEEPETICIAGADGKLGTADDVCANGNSEGETPTKHLDGTIDIPKGGSVIFPNGNEVECPNGGTLHPDGSVTLPDGTKYDASGNLVTDLDGGTPKDGSNKGNNSSGTSVKGNYTNVGGANTYDTTSDIKWLILCSISVGSLLWLKSNRKHRSK